MNARPTLVSPPAGSQIAQRLAGAYFHDAWAVATAHPELSPLDQFMRAARATPAWVDACMRLRNWAVRPFGIKNLGAMSAQASTRPTDSYQVGERVGIFTLLERHPDEVLLGDRDRHLDVIVSVHVSGGVLTLTTVVYVHGWLGRLYMLPVTPMHHLIAQAVLRRLGSP